MDTFPETSLPTPSHLLPPLPEELTAVLPDGFTTEVCPSATEWWKSAAQKLAGGKLLALDYGLTQEEFLNPARANGTLRAYRQHRASSEVLDEPGEVDITAHVNFTAIEAVGVGAGLVTRFFGTQASFLTGIFKRTLDDPAGFAPWTPDRLRQFKTLTHPEHLGQSFKVLTQETPHSSF